MKRTKAVQIIFLFSFFWGSHVWATMENRATDGREKEARVC